MTMAVERSILERLADSGWAKLHPQNIRIAVGLATCGRAAGADQVCDTLQSMVVEEQLDVELVRVGCRGMCWAEPIVEIQLPGHDRAVYGEVHPEEARKLLNDALRGVLREEGLLGYSADYSLGPCSMREARSNIESEAGDESCIGVGTRIVSGRCGYIQPWSAAEYAATGGYKALQIALTQMHPEDVIEYIEASGLRGRGGAGFPTGRKWRAVRDSPGAIKYVIANADEGDPGAFMDRSLMEGDPHSVIEGLALAAYAVGASRGYVFTRSEYPLALATMRNAIAEAESNGLLGSHVLGSDWSFHLEVVRSAGAYVCGEESAMLRALEGFPGRPRRRPPYPSERGLWDAPTCINNVETLATVPFILRHGPGWFRRFGTAESPGTKTFSVAGSVPKPGLIEIPLGSSLLQVIEMVGAKPEDIKAVQIGGPSGAILPPTLDVTLDYEGLSSAGGAMGSGGIVFLGHDSCVVDTVRYFTEFSVRESCGQCVACRDGLKECLGVLVDITEGRGIREDLDRLQSTATYVEDNSMCALGKMAVRPILGSLSYFGEEYEAHLNGECPGLVCRSLIRFEVDAPKCPGCRCCLPCCPTNAMQGRFGKPYHIIERLCIRCRMCIASCPYNAVAVLSSSEPETRVVSM